MNKKNKNIGFIVGAVIIAAILFYGGVKYGEARGALATGRNGQTANVSGGANFSGRAGNGGRFGGNGGAIAGQILSKDSQSLTISLMGGGSRIVFFSASTSVMKAVSGTTNDLQNGLSVTVIGSANPDGSLTAQAIQIRPASSTMPFGRPNVGQPANQ